MNKTFMNKKGTIIYLFTTFPVLTETFLQREMRALREKGLDFEVYSLWGGSKTFEGLTVHCFPKWKLISLIWYFPLFLVKKPRALLKTVALLFNRKMPSLLNGGETLIGLCFGIIYATHFRKTKPRLFHAAWATMPATAAQLLSKLTTIPYSTGAHAYDIFENGGDWLLPEKKKEAQFIQTSTEFVARHLRQQGTNSEKIVVIRRGLHPIPKFKPMRSPRKPLRLLSVGRLIEKKGYFRQLEIYKAMQTRGIVFQARIVGDGRLYQSLISQLSHLKLEGYVTLLGAIAYRDVVQEYNWADLFIYTGTIAANGDRDGLPNVIPEAMAIGVPVIASKSAGVCEALCDGRTGVLINEDESTGTWVEAIRRLAESDECYQRFRTKARKWVEQNFNTPNNVEALYQRFQEFLR